MASSSPWPLISEPVPADGAGRGQPAPDSFSQGCWLLGVVRPRLVVIALCALAPGHAEEEQSASPGSGAKPSEREIGSMHVYLTPAQARLELFPEAVSFQREVRLIPGSFKEDLERRLGRRIDEMGAKVTHRFNRQ